ncbi:MAG: DUF58 domain-containing protein [Deltaproteobacteria bacterium]|nr:DUF58 domain-containing protein [Deltaproteobacteria bacterium]
MISPELYTKIQKFHFKTRFLADDLFAGHYESAFKGKGMEFAEVREYRPGDDVRDIDWNVTARFGKPFVKVYSEERELTVMILVDISGSQRFGTRVRFKRELAAEAAGLLSFVAVRTNDRVGAVLFSDQVHKFVPPRKGPGHVWSLIKEVFSHQAPTAGTDLAAALDYVNRVITRRAIVFLISDFLLPSVDKNMKIAMGLCAKKHDLTAVRITDPAEKSLPAAGLVRVTDPETGSLAVADFSSRRLRELYAREIQRRDAEFSELAARAGVDVVELSTDGSVLKPLTAYFRKREARR